MPNLNWLKTSAITLFLFLILLPFNSARAFEDQHSIEVLTATLQEPISEQAVKLARDFDDKLMSEGKDGDFKVYLVTDRRSDSVNNIVTKLLAAMGEKSDDWIVRVLDTDPQVANAFVTGGKYIYVFTGLIEQASSEDELAFVLSHELGHSLLKHNERRKEDMSTSIANIALLIGMLSKKNRQLYNDFAKITAVQYGRLDEEEADAIGAAIARRAGFNSIRGADFFSRNKLEKEKVKRENQQILEKTKTEAQQSQFICLQATQQFNSMWYKTAENANKVNAFCRDAEIKRLTYNNNLQQSHNILVQEQSNSFFSTHPQDQNRIAALAALADYFNNRRDLTSLSKFKQSHRVMSALNNVNSVLLQSAATLIASDTLAQSGDKQADTPRLTEQLEDLKNAYEKGLITSSEYEQKRLNILNLK